MTSQGFRGIGRSAGSDTRVVEQEDLREGVKVIRKTAMFKLSQADLVDVANSWIIEAKPFHDKFKQKQTRNEKYFLGNQLDTLRLGRYKSRVIINKIWQSLETVIPRATKRLPAPMVGLPFEDDPAKNVDNTVYTNNLEDIMFSLATGLKLPFKLKEFLRYSQLFYMGVLKFGFDKDKGIWVENLRPQRLLVPPRDSDEYVGEYHEDTLRDLIKKFPKKEKQILKSANQGQKEEMNLGTRVGYYEFTTEEFKFWKFIDVILRKVRNPHFDFKNPKKNHWKTPQFDYIFSDLWTMGMSKYSQTTLVDQVIPLQDALNKRKRQISDNADHANGSTIVFGDSGITKKEAAAMESNRGKPNSVTYTKNGVQGGFQHIQGQLLQPYVFDDMGQTITEIDNVFGTHAVTRGEKTPGEETFGGRQLLKESDQERIDELTQMLERVMQQLYNGFAQLIKKHFKKKEYVSFLGTDGTSVQLQIEKNTIREGVSIKVRQGSTVTKDKATLASEAIVLWGQKAIDPISLFERIGDPHPFRTAERLFLWQTAPQELFKKVSAELEKITKADSEKEVLAAIAQAELENRAFAKGNTSVPPFEGAIPQHIAVHQDFFRTPAFNRLPQEIRNAAAAHLEVELETMKAGLQQRKDAETEQLPSNKIVDNTQ